MLLWIFSNSSNFEKRKCEVFFLWGMNFEISAEETSISYKIGILAWKGE